MKTKAIKISSIIAITVLLWACGSNESKEHDHESHEHQHEENGTASMSTASPISHVVQHYIHLKNALVSSNLDEAKVGAKGLLDELNKVDTTKFNDEQKSAWEAQAGIIKENSEHISEAPEISHQREHFAPLSEAMLAMVKTFGGGKTLYSEFCPMANDNKGGYWLSETEEIKNPYFGDEMLGCGEVKETLK
ncbi:MAG TPA: DUF3347 domain-containing protein [Bacteroidia bacterium]|nr:DUF3347 domain-containing protein [Bacteroidia bacterium]